MRRSRVDGNQKQIVDELRSREGFSVAHTHMVGSGFPDIVVGYYGQNYLYEIKDPSQKPSNRRLTADEARWHDLWRGHVRIALTTEDVIRDIEQLKLIRRMK